jgi:hypothetical protein
MDLGQACCGDRVCIKLVKDFIDFCSFGLNKNALLGIVFNYRLDRVEWDLWPGILQDF